MAQLTLGSKIKIRRKGKDIEGIVLAEENRAKYRIYHIMVRKSRAEQYEPN